MDNLEKYIDKCYKDIDGIWVELKSDYIFGTMDCGTVCEETIDELMYHIDSIIKIE